MSFEQKFEEKYKDVALEDASSYYYGEDSAMNHALAKMQEGIDQAAEVFEKLKSEADEIPHVNIQIDQDNLKIYFSTATWDEDEGEYIQPEVFFSYDVGEPMAEALYLMDMMDRSDISTGIRQATNNWVEDLDFDAFGEFDIDYSVADEWGLVQY